MKNCEADSSESTKARKILVNELGDDFTALDEAHQGILIGVCLSGIYQAQSNYPHKNPFPKGCQENIAFRVGFYSVETDIIIPSGNELRWMDVGIIEVLFRKIALNHIVVSRYQETEIMFIGTEVDITRIAVLCESAYTDTHQIYKPMISPSCNIRALIVSFGQ